MRIIVNRESFLATWGAAAGIAPSKSPKPILQNLKLRATDDGTELLATDLEVGVRRDVAGVKVDEPGTVILPLKVGQILKTCRDEDMSITADSERITITGIHASFELPTEDPDLFPDVPEFVAKDYWILEARDLRRAIKRTIFAIDEESTRYALGGILFEFSEARARFVATSGRSLALIDTEIAVEGQPKPSGSPVVPPKALKLIERIVDDTDGPIHIAIDSLNSIIFRTADATVYSRLIEGRFPRYQDVLDCANGDKRVSLPAPALLSGVTQAQILTSDESRGVDFAFNAGSIVLSSQAFDKGKSRIDIPYDSDGTGVTLVFDPYYLESMLRTSGESAVSIRMSDAKNAVVLSTEDGYVFIAMPMTRDR